MKSREECYELLSEYTKKESLIKHALSVEAAMKAYARRLGGDEAEWGNVGLLHDFDYEKYPTLDDHPMRGAEILEERGYPRHWIKAILGHAHHTGVERDTPMAKALFAVDELCGLVTAVAYVRPSRKVADVKVKSVKKKMKDKAFAAAVSRDDIRNGAEDLGVELDEHIQVVIEAMQSVADDLGL